MITDAATARAVMLDPATWSSDRFDGPRPPQYDAWVAELAAEDADVRELLILTPHALIGLDPPDHTRLRNVLRRDFSPAAVEALRPLVEREVEALLPSDVETFSRALPFRVIMRRLAVPEPAWPELERLAHAASTGDTASEDREAVRSRLLAERDIMRFFGADLPAPVRDGTISPREAAGLCRELLVAGSESVALVLAGALRAIARDGMPENVEAFVEHRLAVDPPFPAFWRRATRAVTLGGVAIPPGGLVKLPYALLNRDSPRHLSFGHGIHFCLGAALARLEVAVALRATRPLPDGRLLFVG